MKNIKKIILGVFLFAVLFSISLVTMISNAAASDVSYSYQYLYSSGIDEYMIQDCGGANYKNLNSIAKLQIYKVNSKQIKLTVRGYGLGYNQFCSYFEQILACEKVYGDESDNDILDFDNQTGLSETRWVFAVNLDGTTQYGYEENYEYLYRSRSDMYDTFIITIPLEFHEWYSDETEYEGFHYGSVTFRIFLDENKNNYDSNGNIIYEAGGILLGEDLRSSFVSQRYNSISIINAYKNKDTYAVISCVDGPERLRVGPCTIVSLLGALKGIEISHGYNDFSRYPHPLLGSNIGEGFDNTFNNWFSEQYINISDNQYGNTITWTRTNSDAESEVINDRYMLSQGLTNMDLTYDEIIKLGYHVINRNNGYTLFQNNEAGLIDYLSTEKTGNNWRYVIKESEVEYISTNGKDNSINPDEAYEKILKSISAGLPVQFDDDSFDWVDTNISNDHLSCHAMLAVGVGITREGIKEVIYDQGGGRYCAMPISGIRFFWTLDVKYQELKTVKKYRIPVLKLLPYTTNEWIDVIY